MKYLYIILLCAFMMSCKQAMFLERKYTDGFYFSKSKTLQLNDIHTQKTKNVELSSRETKINSPREPLTDTIITNSGTRIPCKVKTISKKRITYSNNVPGPKGEYKTIVNRKVKRVDFNGTQREYFTESNRNGNPLIQYGLTNAPDRKNGMAIFGSVLTLLLGGILMASVPGLGLLVLALGLGTMIAVIGSPTSSEAYNVFNGIGKFLGILYIVFFALAVSLLIVFLASF